MSADGILEIEQPLPWDSSSGASDGTLLAERLAAAEQELTRCNEEMDILRREAADMQEYYEHYCRELTAAVERAVNTSNEAFAVPNATRNRCQYGIEGAAESRDSRKIGEIVLLKRAQVLYESRLEQAMRLKAILDDPSILARIRSATETAKSKAVSLDRFLLWGGLQSPVEVAHAAANAVTEEEWSPDADSDRFSSSEGEEDSNVDELSFTLESLDIR